MKNTATALRLLTVGLVLLVLYGNTDLLAETHSNDSNTSLDLPRDATLPSETAPVGQAVLIPVTSELEGLVGNPFVSYASSKTDVPVEEAIPTVKTSEYAQACAAFDPIARPEEIADILLYASKVTGTSARALYGVWQSETGNVDGAGISSGDYPVMKELARRCRYPTAGGCRVGKDGRPSNCYNQEACHYFAMERMAPLFNWDLKSMTCSRPSYNKRKHTISGYGGSCGPFQFSGADVDNEYAIPLRVDPMTFCGGALIAGWELKKYRDDALTYRYAKGNDSAWRWAINRYNGSFDGHYYAAVSKKMRRFKSAYDADPKGLKVLRRKLAEDPQTRWSILYMNKYRARFAANDVFAY